MAEFFLERWHRLLNGFVPRLEEDGGFILPPGLIAITAMIFFPGSTLIAYAILFYVFVLIAA